ncbi:MAG TPA: SDR family NAD(P)-dependent oxidoreductase [Nitrososphaeraceae archaeon]|jgi:NAD(P)-dependent dehydrogenase (short-subunit alcohol dehydrogenase family)
MDVTYDFSKKVVLITGGTGALGGKLVKKFLNSGAVTISSFHNEKDAEKLKIENSKVELIELNILHEEQLLERIPKLVKKFGTIDILVNVVGGYLGGKNTNDLSEAEWDKMMNLNLKSAFLISKHVIPVMVSGVGGKIVHISSRTGQKSEGGDSAYAASKAGLIRFVESAAQEFKDSGININCILPTTIDTDANRKAMPNSEFSKWLSTEDLANVILFLCSSGARVINGSAIPTNGLT